MTSPSDHQTTAAKLQHAGITLKAAPMESPLDFNTEWERFARLCGSTVDASLAWKKLSRTMSETYSGETEFDKCLYQDIMKILGESVKEESGSLHLLCNNMQIGIARQVRRDCHLGFPEDYGLTTGAIHDHAVVCVNGERNIVDELSLVELKMDDTNCLAFPVSDGEVCKVELYRQHGALGQALIYTAGDLLNCLSRNGIVEQRLEITVLSGRKQNNGTGKQRCCYVRGSLNIPQFCGERFRFSVLDFKSYEEKIAEKHGLAAYFSAISNGIERANRLGTIPVPLCGRELRIANHFIPSAELVGSPIPRVNLEYAVSQGEIFRAKVSDVLPAQGHSMLWMAESSSPAADETVLIKFGCQSVHQHFVRPETAYLALRELHSHETTRRALSRVLLGVWQINPLGVVTINKELTDFEAVEPKELIQPGDMQNLWNGFINLVSEVLIPMAEKGVVHADIRPGWTKTYNILQKRLRDGTYVLKIIDYESACMVNAVPEDDDFKTFHPDFDTTISGEKYTALRHLWWQCMFTAYCWAMQLDVSEGENNLQKAQFNARTFAKHFQSGILDERFRQKIDWKAVEFIQAQETITSQMVLRTLHILGGVPALSS